MSDSQDETAKSRVQPPCAEKGTPGSDEGEPDQKDEQTRDLDFHPIRIPGEPLSETIIRDRR